MERKILVCPDSHLEKNIRIDLVREEFDKWLSDEGFIELINRFGGTVPSGLSVSEKIIYLHDNFINTWDYRKKQQQQVQTKEGETARWLLEDTNETLSNHDLIFSVSERLGLFGIDKPVYDMPDYYLPLGGANLTNRDRCIIAREELIRIQKEVPVIALSCMRPINENNGEREKVNTYAPEAKTEFDAITAGMKIAFGPLIEKKEVHYDDENPYASYCIKGFSRGENSRINYYCLSGPSNDPEKKYRPTTADNFIFLFNSFHVPEHAKLVNCTSQIYCSVQQIRALFFAIDYNVEFDTIGPRNNSDMNARSKPVNYLQEMKATIDAMYDFVKKYPK